MPEAAAPEPVRSPGAHVAAVIPARGGSKGIPGKNLQQIAGRSLIARAVDRSRASTLIDRVVVSTDSDHIASEARLHGAEVLRRPASLATDASTSESVLLHALDTELSSTTVLVFLQCTSPFVDTEDLDRAIQLVLENTADVAFSVVRSHGFLWTYEDDRLVGVNHDAGVRERRQDRPVEYLETGAFYVLDAHGFRAARHRFFGRLLPIEVDALRAIEVDTVDDLVLARALATILEPGGDTSDNRR